MRGKIIQGDIGDIELAEKVRANIGKLKSEIIELRPAIDELGPEDSGLREKFRTLVNNTAKLDEAHDHLVKVLALSLRDKATMSQKVEETGQQRTKLSIENSHLQRRIEEQACGLRAEAEKWDIRLNGMNHDTERFKKEISALTIDELKLKIETLRRQLAKKYPPGRKSLSGFDILSNPAGKQGPGFLRPELFKVR